MYNIICSEKFKKGFQKLNKQEKRQLQKKIELLFINPVHPSLTTKKVQGTENLFESNAYLCNRFIWKFDGELILLTFENDKN